MACAELCAAADKPAITLFRNDTLCGPPGKHKSLFNDAAARTSLTFFLPTNLHSTNRRQELLLRGWAYVRSSDRRCAVRRGYLNRRLVANTASFVDNILYIAVDWVLMREKDETY